MAALGFYTRPGSIGGATGGSFEDRMRELSNLVGKGKITGTITGDQIYAARQHNSPELSHPRGGEPFFLRDAFNAKQQEHLQRLALQLFSGNTQALFISFVNQVADVASAKAPIELGNLRKSFSTSVKVGGSYIYRKPAQRARMNKTELNSRVRAHHFEKLRRRFS